MVIGFKEFCLVTEVVNPEADKQMAAIKKGIEARKKKHITLYRGIAGKHNPAEQGEFSCWTDSKRAAKSYGDKRGSDNSDSSGKVPKEYKTHILTRKHSEHTAGKGEDMGHNGPHFAKHGDEDAPAKKMMNKKKLDWIKYKDTDFDGKSHNTYMLRNKKKKT